MSRSADEIGRIAAPRRAMLPVVAAAAVCLALCGCNKGGGKALSRRLTSPNVAVRNEALYRLGEDKDESAVEAVAGVLQRDEHRSTRLLAVRALGSIGSEDGVDALVAVVVGTNESREVREAAAEALGRIESGRAVDVLVAQLDDSDLRLTCIWALGNIGDPAAVLPLTDLLDSDDRYVRHNAAQSLRRLGKRR